MLSVRAEAARVINQIAVCQNFVHNYVDSQVVDGEVLLELNSLTEKAFQMITDFVQNHASMFGSTFLYDGVDLALPQNLNIMLSATLFQRVTQLTLHDDLLTEVSRSKKQ